MKKGLLTCGLFGVLGLLLLASPGNEAKAGVPDIPGQTIDGVLGTSAHTLADLTEAVDQAVEQTFDGTEEILNNAPENVPLDDLTDPSLDGTDPPLPGLTDPSLDGTDPPLDGLQDVRESESDSRVVVPLIEWTAEQTDSVPENVGKPVKQLFASERNRSDPDKTPTESTDLKARIKLTHDPDATALVAEISAPLADSEARAPSESLLQPISDKADRTLKPIIASKPTDTDPQPAADDALVELKVSVVRTPIPADLVMPVPSGMYFEKHDDKAPGQKPQIRSADKKVPLQPIRHPVARDLVSIAPAIAPAFTNGTVGGGQQQGGADVSGWAGRWLSILNDERHAMNDHGVIHWIKLLFLKDQYAQAPPLMPPRPSFFAAVDR